MPFTITIDDAAARAALERLADKAGNPRPLLLALGEDIVERTRARFGLGVDPAGTPWAENQPSTIAAYLARRGLKGKKAAAVGAGKRPLAGESGDLARQFSYRVEGATLVVGSLMAYAAMQQFGGRKSRFPHLWGDIPARPFLPVTAAGELYPQERELIERAIVEYLQDPA